VSILPQEAKQWAGAILPLVEHDWLKWSHDEHHMQRENGLEFKVRVFRFSVIV